MVVFLCGTHMTSLEQRLLLAVANELSILITFVITNIYDIFVHNNEHYGIKEAITIA